jgi:hypothetical protein
LKGNGKLPKRNIYWHYPHYHSVGMTPGGAIRSGKWKLIEWYEKSLTGQKDESYELFDLDNDLCESNNLADSLKDITIEMSGKLQKWLKEVNAQIPSIK